MLCCILENSTYFSVSLFTIFLLWFLRKAESDLTLLFYTFYRKKKDYSGKVAWITGASSGIGESLAYDLVRCGAKLVISGVNVERLEKVKQRCVDIRNSPDDILILPFLIQDFKEHPKCVQKVLDHFGQIDILVNNAGVTQRCDFKDIDVEVHRNLFDINVFGALSLTRAVIPHFLSRNAGQIVVTSSTSGKLGAPFSSSYTGSKHALHGCFEALRTELSMLKSNISICMVCPGPVFSNITSRCMTGEVGKLHDEKQSPLDKKMRTERCSELMLTAMANNLDECWICDQPLLTLYYVSQYAPSFFRNTLVKILFTPERAKAARAGK